MPYFYATEQLEPAVIIVNSELNLISPFLDWTQLNEDDLWEELVACILGSKVKFEVARAFASHLKEMGLLNIENLNYKESELEIGEALSCSIPISNEKTEKRQKYRYPLMRANHIYRTRNSIYSNNGSIKNLLTDCNSSREARLKLMSNAVGIGPKQASLFLRNICYSDDLAILDIHVLKYMVLVKLLSPFENVINIINYEKAEAILKQYAKCLGTKLSYLDTSIWIVMRVFNQEYEL